MAIRTSRSATSATKTTTASAAPASYAAIYVRQSLDSALHGGDREAGLAVARQRKACSKLADDRKLTVVAEFCDNDVSASSRRPRKQFEAMLAAIEHGEFSTVIVWAADRLARRPDDLERLIDLAEKTGLRVLTVNGDLDLTNDQGRMVARILVTVARAETERKGARQVAENAQRAERGLPPPGGRVLGYAAGRMKLDSKGAAAVRRAYDDVLAGRALKSIARDLNERGFTGQRGNAWTPSGVRQMLLAPRNAGLRSYQGEIVGKAAWPAIVDEATWRAAIGVLSDPTRRTNPLPGQTRRWWGTGVLRCGVCANGGTLVVSYADGVRRYQCRTGKHLARIAEPVENYVVAAVLEYLSHPNRRDLLIDHDRPDLDALRKRLRELDTMDAENAEDRHHGRITRAQLQLLNAKSQAERAELEATMGHHSRASVLRDIVTAKDVDRRWREYVRNGEVDRQRAIIDALCTVTINKGRRGGNPRKMAGVVPEGSVVVDFFRTL